MLARDPKDVRSSDELVRASYDRIPYPSLPHHLSHPDHLATLAILHGLEPPPLERCSVLELGCSDGGNLIPMAFALPGGRFVGVDLSPRQIARGLSLVDTCGLANIELMAMSLLDVETSLGEFDYIIAHGVFSWVNETARDKILSICGEQLAPQGVAFVSYNTLPGWHFRRILRDLMRYHTQDIEDPMQRTEMAVELIRFLGDSVLEKDGAYGRFLDWCAEHLADFEHQPSYLVHEYLEEDNVPLYFHQFVDLSARHGLQYLGDAECNLTALENLPGSVGETLGQLGGDRIGVEQYTDFLGNRSFRQSLLCHSALDIERTLVAERLRRLHVASSARPESPHSSGDSPAAARFRLPDDNKVFSTSHPMAREALIRLSEVWPAALSFDRLYGDVRQRLRQVAVTDPAPIEEEGVETLADILWTSFFGGVVDLHVQRPPIATTVADRPKASPMARYQAARGPMVTNLWHRPIKLDDEVARLLLIQADGSRDRAGLVRYLNDEVRAGRLKLRLDEQPVEDGASMALVLDRLVESQLQKMAERALLTSVL